MTQASSLADALAALSARPCGLAHEGRRGAPGERADGFCPRAERAANLACAHTGARWALRDALADAARSGDPAAAAGLAEWEALDVAVGLADHARTRAEAAGDAAGIARAVAEHRALASRLAALRASALAALARQENTAS